MILGNAPVALSFQTTNAQISSKDLASVSEFISAPVQASGSLVSVEFVKLLRDLDCSDGRRRNRFFQLD